MDRQVHAMDPQVYRAAKHGDVNLLRQVVNEDCSRLLRLSPLGNTAIHVSVRFGHIEFLREVYGALLQHNSSLEGDTSTDYSRSLSLLTEVNSVGDTPLHVAAREGHSSIAEFLIQKILPWLSDDDHDLDVESSGQNISSVVTGRNREREVLLGRQKIRMRNNSNNTAMHEAVQMNDLKMVKSLTKADHPNLWFPIFEADAEAYGGPYGRTALHEAVVEEHVGVVKILLEKKGETIVNKVDENGRTALHYAASKGLHKVVELLLRSDTLSAYQLDKDGLSPLHIAAMESNNIRVLRELIEWCPDSVELQDKKRRNVLHYVVMSKEYLKKLRFALKQQELKVLINQADEDGNTPYHLAARQGSFVAMNYFHSNKRLDPRATNNNGQTAADIIDCNSIARKKSSILMFPGDFLDHFRWLHYARRGEEKWMVGGLNEEKIQSDPNKQAEVAEAARSDVTHHNKEMGKTLQIVASLIATVTFTAVFQVPGGYKSGTSDNENATAKNDDGTPVLVNNKSFKYFLQLDALAMSLSIISLMVMFVAPLGGKVYYSSSLTFATILTCAALTCTSLAFFEGVRAVLPPPCEGGFLECLFFDDHSTPTYSFIGFPLVTYVDYVLLTGLGFCVGFWLRRFVESRYAKFRKESIH